MIHIPNDSRIKPLQVPHASDADLLARHRRLRLTNGYLAASIDNKSTMRHRAKETYAIEAELIRRGLLDRADAIFQGDPKFVTPEEWFKNPKHQGLGFGKKYYQQA